MPPRKRAASAPKDGPEQELAAPVDEGAEGDAVEDEAPDVVDNSAALAAEDTHQTGPAGDEGPEPDVDPKPDDVVPERSDLQNVDQPCKECCPNGWPENAFSVGCTHGTWVRKQD
ncbi:hypothetical protein ACIGMX_34460 [Streptomyces aquilus]|uniref:hypothetical protein n=1 Tax=Streptomyces aquilus TaxID=2548456 RepID=UPI0037D37954